MDRTVGGVRTPDWHLVEWHGTQLYDLRYDPYEQYDVSQFHSAEVTQLTQLGRTLVGP